MDDNDALLRVPTIPQDVDPADGPVSHLLPDSRILQHEHSADDYPSDDSPSSAFCPVEKHGFFRTWRATATSIRPTGEPTNIEWGIHWSRLAVACSLATSIARFIALGQNRIASNKSVSAIIRTTRNRTVDECIVGGDCLGGEVMSLELQKLKLQFGALKAGKMGTAPVALGVKGEIYPIKRD